MNFIRKTAGSAAVGRSESLHSKSCTACGPCVLRIRPDQLRSTARLARHGTRALGLATSRCQLRAKILFDALCGTILRIFFLHLPNGFKHVGGSTVIEKCSASGRSNEPKRAFGAGRAEAVRHDAIENKVLKESRKGARRQAEGGEQGYESN